MKNKESQKARGGEPKRKKIDMMIFGHDDRTRRDIDLVERGEIEDRVVHWIQEIERVVEESMDHMEEI
eukprot:2830860-Karenia_brevis.AAC.1